MEKTYKLVWNGEIIEHDLTKEDADYLQGEYNIAFKGGVTIEEE